MNELLPNNWNNLGDLPNPKTKQDWNKEEQEWYNNLAFNIAEKVEEFLHYDKAAFFSFLYRIDVLEKDVRKCLEGSISGNPSLALAKFILDKLITSYRFRKEYKSSPLNDKDEFVEEW